MKFRGEWVLYLFLLALLVVMLARVPDFNYSDRWLPSIIGIPTILLLLWGFGRDIIKSRHQQNKQGEVRQQILDITADTSIPIRALIPRVTNASMWVLGLILAVWLVGFPAGAPLFALLYIKIAGHEDWKISLALTALVALIVAGLFDQALNMMWPPSLLERWLGF